MFPVKQQTKYLDLDCQFIQLPKFLCMAQDEKYEKNSLTIRSKYMRDHQFCIFNLSFSNQCGIEVHFGCVLKSALDSMHTVPRVWLLMEIVKMSKMSLSLHLSFENL